MAQGGGWQLEQRRRIGSGMGMKPEAAATAAAAVHDKSQGTDSAFEKMNAYVNDTRHATFFCAELLAAIAAAAAAGGGWAKAAAGNDSGLKFIESLFVSF